MWETLKGWLQTELYVSNEAVVTPLSFVLAFGIVGIALIVSGMVRGLFKSRVAPRLTLHPGVLYAIGRFLHYLIILIGLLLAVQPLGINVTNLALMFSFLGVGIGFGLQNITSNFISGLILLLERPVSVGDYICVGDQEGIVQEIRMRATIINTLDNITIIVPNSRFIEQEVINWSHGDTTTRIHVPVGVAYGSDLEVVRGCLLDCARNHDKVLDSPAPEPRFLGFGDSSLDFELYAWIRYPRDKHVVRSELNYAIDAAFRAAGVTIPFPQRDLHLQLTPAVDRLAGVRQAPPSAS